MKKILVFSLLLLSIIFAESACDGVFEDNSDYGSKFKNFNRIK